MRRLVIGALVSTLVGCSCPLRQQAGVNSCLDVDEFFCSDGTAVRRLIEPKPVSFKTNSAPQEIKPAVVAKTKKPSSAVASHEAHLDVEMAKSTMTAAKVKRPASRTPLSSRSLDTRPPASNAAADSNVTSATAYSRPPDDAVANSNTRAIREQVESATAAAELLTRAASAPAPDHSETQLHRDAEKTASEQPNTTDLLVAVLLARPKIKLVPDLAGKIIAIDDRYSVSNGNVRTAIAAAGAAEVQLSEGQAKAIDRLISGEVLAAVLTLVSAEAADRFPEIAGFKIFRIPLSPRSLEPRPKQSGKDR